MQQLRTRSGKRLSGVSAETMELLARRPWPGNVRELRGVLEHAFVVAETGPITPAHLPAAMKSPTGCRKDREFPAGSAAQEEKQLCWRPSASPAAIKPRQRDCWG